MQIILKISVVLLSWCIYFTAAENRQGCWPNSDFYVMVFPENLKLNWTQHNDNCVTSIVYSDILNNTKITCFSNNKPKEFSVTSRYFDPVNNRNEYISDFIEIGSLTIRKTDEYILLRVLCPSAIIYSMVLYCRSSSDLGPEFKIRVTYPDTAPVTKNTDNETTLKLSTTPAPKTTVKPTPAPITTTLTTTKLVPDTRDSNPAEKEYEYIEYEYEKQRINPDAAPVLTNKDEQTTVKAATIQAEPATTPVPNTTVMLATTLVPETTDYTYYTYVSGGCVGFAICFFVTLALFCIRKYRQSRLEQPELVYSYVAVEKVSHYAARALVTSNKKLGERSFVPRVPLRPGEYDYARPKQQPQFGDLEYDYATVGRNKQYL